MNRGQARKVVLDYLIGHLSATFVDEVWPYGANGYSELKDADQQRLEDAHDWVLGELAKMVNRYEGKKEVKKHDQVSSSTGGGTGADRRRGRQVQHRNRQRG